MLWDDMTNDEFLRRLSTEEHNSLNMIKYLEVPLKQKVDILTRDFFMENVDRFDGIFKKDLYAECDLLREQVFDVLLGEFERLSKEFREDSEGFNEKYGWFESNVTRTRYQITEDDFASTLCELIRRVYYVHLNNKFPERYQISFFEKFLMRNPNEE